MTRNELKQLISEGQKRQSAFGHVEVKTARGGTPKLLYESISAFANRTGGGALLFGLDESKNFSVFGYLSGRGQPTHDEEIVPDATLEDLHRGLGNGTLVE